MSTDQKFSTSFAKDGAFQNGMRDFLEYRDLGVADASNGQFHAHIVRVKKNSDVGDLHTTGLHQHHLNFQMIFIVKGWIKFTYENEGEFTFGPGDCCMQPAGIVHNELDCSEDLELLEITSPAKFKTSKVAEAA